MAVATTNIWLYTGAAAGTTSDVSGSPGFRHKQADDGAIDLTAPVPIPSAGGENFSWRKHTKLVFTSDPSQKISNLRWYTVLKSGLSGWTGLTMYVGLTNDAGYVQGSSSDSTTKMTQESLSDGDSYISSTPLTVNGGDLGVTATTPVPATGTQKYVVQQIGVGDAAAPGVTADRTCYYRYNEI